MIIAIMGRKYSGKDTMGKILCEFYGFERMRFSNPLKEIVKIMFDWNNEHIEGKLKEIIDKRWGISPRQAMQCVGTDFSQYLLCELFPEFKKITGRKIWANRFKLEYLKNIDKKIVITDLRFPHEHETIKSLKGIVIKVERNIENIDNHESEKYIDSMPYDYLIQNTNSYIQDFYVKIHNLCKSMKLEKIIY